MSHQKITLIVAIFFCLSLGFGFVHPRQLEAQRVRQIEREKAAKTQQPSAYTMVNILAGNMTYATYSKQMLYGYYEIEYAVISHESPGFRISLGSAVNQDNAGNILRTLPLSVDWLWGYPFKNRMGAFVGLGLGYNLLQDAVQKQGLHYRFLTGLSIELSQETALLVEYNKDFLNIEGVNFDRDLLKFGLSFKFWPEPIQPARRPLR